MTNHHFSFNISPFYFYGRRRLQFTQLIIITFFKIFSCKADLIAENISLRQQLTIYKRKHKKIPITNSDRIFWIFISKIWSKWKSALIIIKPETVLRWQCVRSTVRSLQMIGMRHNHSPGYLLQPFMPNAISIASLKNNVKRADERLTEELTDLIAVAFDGFFLDDFPIGVENTDRRKTKMDIQANKIMV